MIPTYYLEYITSVVFFSGSGTTTSSTVVRNIPTYCALPRAIRNNVSLRAHYEPGTFFWKRSDNVIDCRQEYTNILCTSASYTKYHFEHITSLVLCSGSGATTSSTVVRNIPTFYKAFRCCVMCLVRILKIRLPDMSTCPEIC